MSAEALVGRHVLSVEQFSRQQLDYIFAVANTMHEIVEKRGACDFAKGKVLATLFYEPSTRTSSSFQAAMLRLGGTCICVTEQSSSVVKGESLRDTVRTLQSYADVIICRHPVSGSIKDAASCLQIPLLNAGDGVGEHPTQALLDIYTILSERGQIDGATVTMMGDLKHGRTVHSLAKMLAVYSDVKLNYISPESLCMPRDVIHDVARISGRSRISQHEHTFIDEVLPETDVLYVTRLQKERLAHNPQEYKQAQGWHTITPALLRGKAKTSLCILHPLPRVDELSEELDSDPRAAYFRQMRYGLYVRMALLAIILGCAPPQTTHAFVNATSARQSLVPPIRSRL